MLNRKTSGCGVTGGIVGAVLLLAVGRAVAAEAPIQLEVDARDVIRGVQHAHLTLPAKPGPLTLAYPKWVPGEHGPNGPITQMANLHIRAAGAPLAWSRDPRDAFLFHIAVPPGVRALDIQFDYLSPPAVFGVGFGDSPASTQHLLTVLFAQLVLYPASADAARIAVRARVRLPAGWHTDDALLSGPTGKDVVALPTVSLATLADSPLLAGEFFLSRPIRSDGAPIRLSMAADAPDDLAADDRILRGLDALPAETAAVFGPGHYRRYVWLLALSDSLSHDGAEHHESSDVREAERLFSDPARAIDWRLFPHEYVHTWNGKYRRPAGLATRNYQQPMIDDLLWVYEGLTRYYGDFVLAGRSGLYSADDCRAYLAFVAAQMDRERPGRAWRSLGDTATAAPAFAAAPKAWTALRRGLDYYNEMLLVWLEVDMTIRDRTAGRRSLDDFSRLFFGGPERFPAVRPYSRADLEKALGRIAPMDWRAFFASRIDAIQPKAPLDGLRAGGWRLVYTDQPNPFVTDLTTTSGVEDLSLSLGVSTDRDGKVRDVVPDSAAWKAGMAPGVQLISVNGRAWSGQAIRDAILAAENHPSPIVLVTRAGHDQHTLTLDYHDGLRLPHLVRDESRPDRLSELLAPRAPPLAGPVS